jgi:hypothetical protein
MPKYHYIRREIGAEHNSRRDSGQASSRGTMPRHDPRHGFLGVRWSVFSESGSMSIFDRFQGAKK